MIPKKIVQVLLVDGGELPTDIPDGFAAAMQSYRDMNPRYTYKLFSGNECRAWITTNYSERELRAFDKVRSFSDFVYEGRFRETSADKFKTQLVPYTYKCDLFRLLYVFRVGGWYADARQVRDGAP